MELESKAISDNASRMGRPPMGLKPTPVRLPTGTAERIDALVGLKRRAAFIREAVERELERREKKAKGK